MTPTTEGSGRSVEGMDNRTEVRDFLASRRARLSPEQVGLTSYGSRRVPGLRRAEVAQLAGVSIEYYTRFERGNLSGVSEAVLDSLVVALQLDESERAYLFDLAKAASAPSTPRRPRKATAQEVRPSIQRLLDAMTGIPAFVRNGRLDILAVNAMGRALYSQAFDSPPDSRPVNFARFVFLDPRAPCCTRLVGLGQHERVDPAHRGWPESVRQRPDRSGRGAVHAQRGVPDSLGGAQRPVAPVGTKHFHHPAVGDLHLSFDALELPGGRA